jgi:hypothetical protein
MIGAFGNVGKSPVFAPDSMHSGEGLGIDGEFIMEEPNRTAVQFLSPEGPGNFSTQKKSKMDTNYFAAV